MSNCNIWHKKTDLQTYQILQLVRRSNVVYLGSLVVGEDTATARTRDWCPHQPLKSTTLILNAHDAIALLFVVNSFK